MSDLPPDWAIEKVKQLHRKEGGATVPMAHAFARYIAEHEEPPVDPLLVEARNICASRWDDKFLPIAKDIAEDFRLGRHDDDEGVEMVLRALRRGIEIGKGDQ